MIESNAIEAESADAKVTKSERLPLAFARLMIAMEDLKVSE